MITYIRHWYYLLRAGSRAAMAFARAALYFNTRAKADLRIPPGVLPGGRVLRRWRHYFYGTTYLAVVFECLAGDRLTRREQALFGNLAALACFFDDLSDTPVEPGAGEKAWLNNPEQYAHAADGSGLALHFLKNIEAMLPPGDLPLFRQFMHRVFNLETAGRQRSGPPPAAGELARLTDEKGGYSVLLFRRALARAFAPGEQEALRAFGALVQRCDDMFDVWFDRQSGTATLATLFTGQNDPAALRDCLEQQVAAACSAFRRVACRRSDIETALHAVYFLAGITRVCVEHYIHLKKKHGTLPLDNRRDMVVDMGRWPNRWRAAGRIFLDIPNEN